MHRRDFVKVAAFACAAAASGRLFGAPAPSALRRYAIASSIFGNLPLREILAEMKRQGWDTIDLWPRVHGTQREEADALGYERLSALLAEYGVRVGLTTRFDLPLPKLRDEIAFVRRLGGNLIVTGAKSPPGLAQGDKRGAIKGLVEEMKPLANTAGESGVAIAIENHAGSFLLESRDDILWFADAAEGLPFGVALAPSHLDQDPAMLAGLIRDLGPKLLLFYAWQFGKGFMKPMSSDDELLQLPGRGPLDFSPLVAALSSSGFKGWTEVFMHHTPRGQPALPSAGQIGGVLKQAEGFLASLPAAASA